MLAPKIWVKEGTRVHSKFQFISGHFVPRSSYIAELKTTFGSSDVAKLLVKNPSEDELIAIATSRGWPAFTMDDWYVLVWAYGLD